MNYKKMILELLEKHTKIAENISELRAMGYNEANTPIINEKKTEAEKIERKIQHYKKKLIELEGLE